jgi:hypothetical protein
MGDNRETTVVDSFGFAHDVQPRHPRGLGDGHQRRAQPHPHDGGAGLARRDGQPSLLVSPIVL